MWSQKDFGTGKLPCSTIVVLHTDSGEESMYNDFELENINAS